MSFDENEANLHPYPDVLIVALPIADVSTPKVSVVLGLNGSLTKVKGRIKLIIEAGEAPRKARFNPEFVVLDSTSSYDAIMENLSFLT